MAQGIQECGKMICLVCEKTPYLFTEISSFLNGRLYSIKAICLSNISTSAAPSTPENMVSDYHNIIHEFAAS